ncbi:glycosyl hydrolase family 8 [Chitinispirillales bacterium ANBcel5]|uniref:glycosyl hydrolase family 8 n=1 Tax=Cellulosispirillum alkaliphilum TaxID=3039283 RepID=UPI002A507134|nr:glycosyl hydrolase family 8 [Chitinispirillales bacterium ANBcel5]
MNIYRYLLCSLLLAFFSTAAQTESDDDEGLFADSDVIEIHINSGDPAFPFPQFLPYENKDQTLHNLGTQNSAGVPHAEMERTMREAYRIMMNRAVYPGGGVDGTDYVYFRSIPSCTEGTGYAMLAAVAMADKVTFDGLWLWLHDNAMNNVRRYSDCEESSPGYRYSQLPGWTHETHENSAADGDFDIALALLYAYKQWGEYMGIDDACGNPISYKKAAIDFIKAMTDTIQFVENDNYVSGNIGLDGYFKGGDSWQELTDWASDPSRTSFSFFPEARGPRNQYFDYTAPAYFHQFRKFLSKEDEVAHQWNIMQYHRGEASSDWLIGQLYEQDERNIPFAGDVAIGENNVPEFGNVIPAEDIRLPWRTILNYVWHGNPTYTWDPHTHQVIEDQPNTFQRDMALRYARFLWDNRQDPWNNPCVEGASEMFTYWGPQVLWTDWDLDGSNGRWFFLNWISGTGAPSAVVSQDFDLMSDMFRKCEIEWDVEDPGEGYLSSTPFYFHGWFRLLGMLVLSGNYHAPSEMTPSANMKVYLDIDKTFGFEGDTVTYTIDYRNFGSIDARDVVIVDTLHQDFEFIEASGPVSYDPSSHVVTWNIGTVPGFRSATGIPPTKGQVELVVRVAQATQEQYRNRVTISCSNGTGWTSNDYPNNITTVMERNHLDIASRALVIEKSASAQRVNPGDTVQFNVDFENTSEAGWIDGGRPGVHFSYSGSSEPKGTMNTMRLRLFHDANEAYIDYGNYRISYFLFDPGLTCYAGEPDCQNGWQVMPTIVEGIEEEHINIFQENITAGEDSRGKWNQRIVVQFSDPEDPDRIENLSTVDHHLREYAGMTQRIHRGGTMPLRLVWFLNPSTWVDVDWSEDWSYNPDADDDDDGRYWPITNDWTDPDNPDVPVNRWDPKSCEVPSQTIDNVLIEEWDGYTWRRVAGDGPTPGRDISNVVIRDTIPPQFTFLDFVGEAPLGVDPQIDGNVITWTIPRLQIEQKGTIRYLVRAEGDCPAQDISTTPRAWINADRESAVSDSAPVTITCRPVSPPPPPPTTMDKQSNSSFYQVGDTIHYTITYEQTHGSIITDASDPQNWTDIADNGLLSIDSDGVISIDRRDAMMVYRYSYGINGTISALIDPQPYSEFSIIARNSGSDYIDIRLKQEYGDMLVSFYNNEAQVGHEQTFSYSNFPDAFNLKIELNEDTISLWAGDTSATLPNVRQSGFDIRSGYAGIRSGNDLGGTVSNWGSHLDAGLDVAIEDPLPEGLSFISAGGEITSGVLRGTTLSAEFSDNTVRWPVVSGDSWLYYGDSVTVWFSALYESYVEDTIINTAYAQLRGHGSRSIAAQDRTPVQIQTGPPYRVHIITDTSDIDMRHYDNIGTVILDEITSRINLFAVIRDEYGNFISPATSAHWMSLDETVVSASGIDSEGFVGEIIQTGEGETAVIASQNELKPDTVILKTVEAPPWPIIVEAIMGDRDGNIIPDHISITLTENFGTNQNLKHVEINYRGERYTIPASETTLNGTELYVPFVTVYGEDPVPEGEVTIVMDIDGEEKRSSREFTDGVGPALRSAFLAENLNTDIDTLILQFTEEIDPNTLTGNSLELIYNSADTTTLLVVYVIESDDNTTVSVLIVADESVSISEGDLLRLVPGERGGRITDLANNTPHLLNPAVIIRGRPGRPVEAWYVDESADGVVDAVYMKFSKPVITDELLFSLAFGGPERIDNLSDQEYFSVQQNDSLLKIYLPESFKTQTGIRTAGYMHSSISYTPFPQYEWGIEVKDSAAPVIMEASITAGISDNSQEKWTDTLTVFFSENVVIENNSNPFLLLRPPNPRYTFDDLQPHNVSGSRARFTFQTTSPVDYPLSGDMIWINPENPVADMQGNRQTNSANRRVEVTIESEGSKWRVDAAPVPFNPEYARTIHFFVTPENRTRYRPNVKEAYITIYDALGNVVLPKAELISTRDGFKYDWDVTNTRGRKVGTGSYLAIVSITDSDSGRSNPSTMIGIVR